MLGTIVTQDSERITTKTTSKPNITEGDNSRFRIHPGVGVARVGNSQEDFFIGPEAPGWNPFPEGGAYKDDAGCSLVGFTLWQNTIEKATLSLSAGPRK